MSQFRQPDSLETAFELLEDEGIIARHDWSCCTSCGHIEIGVAIEQAWQAGKVVEGYVFYHHEDTEDAQETGLLQLSYGCAELIAGAAMRAIGRRVVDALLRAGLRVTWNGSEAERIVVYMTRDESVTQAETTGRVNVLSMT